MDEEDDKLTIDDQKRSLESNEADEPPHKMPNLTSKSLRSPEHSVKNKPRTSDDETSAPFVQSSGSAFTASPAKSENTPMTTMFPENTSMNFTQIFMDLLQLINTVDQNKKEEIMKALVNIKNSITPSYQACLPFSIPGSSASAPPPHADANVQQPTPTPTAPPFLMEVAENTMVSEIVVEAPVKLEQTECEVINVVDTQPVRTASFGNGKESKTTSMGEGSANPSSMSMLPPRQSPMTITVSSQLLQNAPPQTNFVSTQTISSPFATESTQVAAPTNSMPNLITPVLPFAVPTSQLATSSNSGNALPKVPSAVAPAPQPIGIASRGPVAMQRMEKVPALQAVPNIVNQTKMTMIMQNQQQQRRMMQLQQQLQQQQQMMVSPTQPKPPSTNMTTQQLHMQQFMQQQNLSNIQQQMLRSQQQQQQQIAANQRQHVEHQKQMVLQRINLMYGGKATKEQIEKHISGPSLIIKDNEKLITMANPFYPTSPSPQQIRSQMQPQPQQLIQMNGMLMPGQLGQSLPQMSSPLSQLSVVPAPSQLMSQVMQPTTMATIPTAATAHTIRSSSFINGQILVQQPGGIQYMMQPELSQEQLAQIHSFALTQQSKTTMPSLSTSTSPAPLSQMLEAACLPTPIETSECKNPLQHPSTLHAPTFASRAAKVDSSRRECNEWSVVSVPLPTQLHIECSCFGSNAQPKIC